VMATPLLILNHTMSLGREQSKGLPFSPLKVYT
jgi:hypothetical protein